MNLFPYASDEPLDLLGVNSYQNYLAPGNVVQNRHPCSSNPSCQGNTQGVLASSMQLKVLDDQQLLDPDPDNL